MTRRCLRLLASLRLTVVSLGLALVLVFLGTLAQAEHGLYRSQTTYFRSFVVWWRPGGTDLAIPILPGAYTLGTLLVVNLLAAHAVRFRVSRKRLGILMIHAGLVMLLMGQVATDLLSEEGTMRLARGDTTNYSEDLVVQELAVFDGTNPVAAIPVETLAGGREVPLGPIGVAVHVKGFWPHAEILARPTQGARPLAVTRGAGRGGFYLLPLPPPARPDERSLPAAVVELVAARGSLGSFVLSPLLRLPQTFEHAGRSLEIALGPRRHYKPYALTLVDLRHDVYTGTSIPRNFSSRVRIRNPETREDREVRISMNHPLRYRGDTYYQYQMEKASGVSVLQVVRNPSWLTPYLSCGLVGLGLLVQFLSHLVAFSRTRPA